MPSVSIIMTAYKRGELIPATLDSIFKQNTSDVEVLVIEDGFDCITKAVCDDYPVRYFNRQNRPDVCFANPAPLMNCGIKNARGEILIIQNAECLHYSKDVIKALVKPHESDNYTAVFAACLRLQEETEPTNLTSPYFFCGSIRKEVITMLGGVDEDYTGWGSDDCDLGLRMEAAGIHFIYRPDIVVHHQYHGISSRQDKDENRALFDSRSAGLRFKEISPVVNQNRDWGII